ncbi:hypothetical protein ABPG74_013792 [Tetrahymena malaccensis]
MMLEQSEGGVDHIIQENKDLKKALKQLKNTLDRTIDDYETLKNIHEDYKQHYQKLKEEKSEQVQRIQVVVNEKNDLENHYEQVAKNLKNQIEEKQREIEYIQAKVLPSLDQDMIRVRLLNELEAPHRIELEAKQLEIERLQEKQYDLKRQLELFKTKYEVITAEAQRDIRELKEKHKIELKDMMLELQINQEKTIETQKEKQQAKMFKKEAEELRALLLIKDEDIFNLKKLIDQEKQDKSDQIQKFVEEISELKEQMRQSKTENEKLQDHISDLENEIKHQYQKQQQSPNQKGDLSPKRYIDYQGGELHQLRDNEYLIKNLQAKIQEQKQKFEEEIQINRQAEKKMEDQIDKLRREKRDLQNEYQKFISESSDKLSDEKRKVLDLQNKVKDLDREKDSLTDQIRQLQNQSGFPKEIRNFSNNAKDLQNLKEVESLARKNRQLKEKLKEANQKIMKLLSEKILEKKRDQDIQIMNQHNSQLNGLINQYNTQGNVGTLGSLNQNLKSQALNYSAPNIQPNNSYQGLQTNNYNTQGAIQNTGNFYTVADVIKTDLDHHRDRLNHVKNHIEDMNRISNQQFYKPY